MTQKYYTTSDVARICGVHRNTIIGAIRKGLLNIYRTPGGHARVSEEDLKAFCGERNLPASAIGNRNDKVLVVDDDQLLTRVIRRGLEKAGYRVRIAENGYDAGFLTIEWNPDVMLLDIMLPDIRGDYVARRVRESEHTAALPIIGMSAVSDQSKVEALMEAGANTFMPKPFEVSEIVNRIISLIGPINTSVPVEEEAPVAARA